MQKALRFIILLGVISLLGDITYEGARSVTGPFFATFGVSATVVGFITGFGEFSGYALRLVSGYLADKTGRYWLMTFLGYSLLLAVPLLALANQWEIAAILIIAERAGKAIRSPSRDAMLSFASKKVGRGMGFGLHEAVDQIGAIVGPLLFSALFLLHYGYKEGFAIMLIPAILTLSVLTFARIEYPTPHLFEIEVERSDSLNKVFWLYTMFIFVSTVGFANFQLISYHFKVQAVFHDEYIPLLYAVAMAMDASFALLIGRTYDRIGMRTLFLIPLLTPLILFSFSNSWVITGVVVWGAVMGMQETILRAGIADLVHPEKRSTAYGLFNTAYGLAWLAGSVSIGFLYEISLTYLTVFVVFVEFVAFLLLLLLARTEEKRP